MTVAEVFLQKEVQMKLSLKQENYNIGSKIRTNDITFAKRS